MIQSIYLCALVLFFSALSPTVQAQSPRKVKQRTEVVEAYRVIQRFQNVLAQNLDFDPAFEATFSKSESRRRQIAITEGDFGGLELDSVDTRTLVGAFKSRMLVIYLMLALLSGEIKSPDLSKEIKDILDRKPPDTAQEFDSFAVQLKKDATTFRAYVERLAQERPEIAEQIRKFKEELSKKLKPPTNYAVKPLTSYSRGKVLGLNDPYYSIENYALIREKGEMRIIGIRLFKLAF